jgi:hypothetical protein
MSSQNYGANFGGISSRNFAEKGIGLGANLIPAVRNFSITSDFVGDTHEVDEGCVPPGKHKVLRFDFVSQNLGNADFVFGRPTDRPDLFVWSEAHGHYHMKEFNQYKLFDAGLLDLVERSAQTGVEVEVLEYVAAAGS